MGKTFEDEFMEVQTGMVSLGLEVMEILKKKPSKLFVHCVNDDGIMFAFEYFVEINGQLLRPYQMGANRKLLRDYFSIGVEDIEKIEKLCQQYNMETPTEMRLHYDVVSGGFEATYRYDRLFPDVEWDIDADDAFENDPYPEGAPLVPGDLLDLWIEEERQKLAAN